MKGGKYDLSSNSQSLSLRWGGGGARGEGCQEARLHQPRAWQDLKTRSRQSKACLSFLRARPGMSPTTVAVSVRTPGLPGWLAEAQSFLLHLSGLAEAHQEWVLFSSSVTRRRSRGRPAGQESSWLGRRDRCRVIRRSRSRGAWRTRRQPCFAPCRVEGEKLGSNRISLPFLLPRRGRHVPAVRCPEYTQKQAE